MSSVILDAGTIDVSLEIVNPSRRGILSDFQIECFSNLLTGIVLWDDLPLIPHPWIDNNLNLLDNADSLIEELCRLFVPFESSLLESSSYVPFESGLGYERYVEGRSNGIFSDDDKNTLIERTNIYLELSAKNRFGYIPYPIRRDYFKSNSSNRENLTIKQIEKALEENKICNAICLDTSLLFNFIKANGNDTPRKQLRRAIELRNEDDVVALRKSLSKFENKYAPVGYIYESIGLEEASEILNKVLNKHLKSIGKGRASLEYGTDGVRINRPLPTFSRKKYDRDFLIRLVEFKLGIKTTKKWF